jgi:hypothetical protein
MDQAIDTHLQELNNVINSLVKELLQPLPWQRGVLELGTLGKRFYGAVDPAGDLRW